MTKVGNSVEGKSEEAALRREPEMAGQANGDRREAAGKVVYTLGTSTRTMEEFLGLLALRGIARICDVRSFPTSRRYPHFSREAFATSLKEAGYDYRWVGESLGGYRKGGYEAGEVPTAVVCAELLPWRCHRRHIAAALQQRGWRVVHVIDAEREWVPRDRPETVPLLEDGDARDE